MRRILEILVLVVVCAGAALYLVRPAPPPAGTSAPFTIQGARPGMARAEVEALLGRGRPLEVLGGVETTLCAEGPESPTGRWATVTWDSSGRAGRVAGSHLHRDGREVLGRGWAEAEALAALGPPDSRGSTSEGIQVLAWRSLGLSAQVREGRLVSFTLGE